MTKRRPDRLLSIISLREVSGSSTGAMPARASRGSVSSKVRPLARAMVSGCTARTGEGGSPFYRRCAADLGDAADACAERGELLFDPLVAAIEVVDAIDRGLSFGDQPADDQTGGGAQIGRHHGRAGQPGNALDDRGIALDLDVG